MAPEQPLWRGEPIPEYPKPGSSLVYRLIEPIPPGHEVVVLSASHYDALVERVEELETSDYAAEVTRLRGAIDDLDEDLADAQLDAEGWEKEARKAEARVAELTDAIKKVDLERLTFDDLLKLVDDA